MDAIRRLWNRLGLVRSLSFVAAGCVPGWTGRGQGAVIVTALGLDVLTFDESGVWQPMNGRALRFHNSYRWTLQGESLRLEHLRFGPEKPVYLFDLSQASENEWRSVAPHLCREDCYSARLVVREGELLLDWAVDGPSKRERIEYVYAEAIWAVHDQRGS